MFFVPHCNYENVRQIKINKNTSKKTKKRKQTNETVNKNGSIYALTTLTTTIVSV